MTRQTSKIEEAFRAVGVTSARGKILALCSAPTLFIDCETAGEEYCMTYWVPFVVAGILGEHIAKYDVQFKMYIQEGLLNCPPNERRALTYSLADPSFVDAYIAGLEEAYAKLKELRKENDARASALMEAETGCPMFSTITEYREYHGRKAANNS